MNLTKRVVTLLVVLVIGFVLVACGGGKEYEITFKDDLGNTLEVVKVAEGRIPVYSKETPSKSNSDTSSYEFSGWEPVLEIATEDKTYVAVFTETKLKFTITWQDADGTKLGDDLLEVGTMPSRDLPRDTAKYEYISWDKEVVAVNGNTTYRAIANTKKYTVTWQDADGVVLYEEELEYGTMPSYDLPSDTEQYEYTGWDKEITTVTGNVTYKAVREERSYKLTLINDDSIDTETYKYGTKIETIFNPEKDGYVFIGWFVNDIYGEKVEFPYEITTNVTFYAAYNEVVPFGEYLTALLESYRISPYSFIPENMRAGANLSNKEDIDNYDIESNFVNISDLPTKGFGEQWNMVLDNIRQSERFYNILSVVDIISASSVLAFNNYLDTNPDDTNNFETEIGIYNVTIKVNDNIIYYVLDYTADIPMFGENVIQIMLSYNIKTLEKTGRIQIGDANALKYEITPNSYSFGIRYLGVRRAYFEINKNEDDSLEGSISEFLGVGSAMISSAAKFYIDKDYTSAVGNKADGMIGFTSTITELYATSTGKFLGYEIEESIVSIIYNTLWFNLNDTTGIENIKNVLDLDDEDEESNEYKIHINNSETPFQTKNFSGINPKTLSRRFDIELRTQYVYYQDLDEDGKEVIYEVKIQVPMLFIQEEKLDELAFDIVEKNDVIVNFSLEISELSQNKLMDDYRTLVPLFKEYKDTYTAEYVLEYIGEKY